MQKLTFKKSFSRTAALLLSCGMVVSQLPSYAQVIPEAVQAPVAPPTAAQTAVMPSSEQPQMVAQATPGTTVLQGRVSNVDTISRDILRDEIKLEKFNLHYRLNAAKQGRWKGWRYFFFQETKLGLTEAMLIQGCAYRGAHLHNPSHNRASVITNSTILPGIMAFWFGGTGDIIELGVNMFHSWQASKNGFSQTQARKYVGGVVAGIDKKLAEREALIRQEPSSDSETAQLQVMEGKVLADFRDLSIAEFERFHIGASRVLARENSFYALDTARCVMGIVDAFLGANLVMRHKSRMIGSFAILSTVVSGFTGLDPIFSRLIGNAAAAHDRKMLQAAGLPPLAQSGARLQADYSQMKDFGASHRGSDKPEIAAALGRLDAYDANNTYYIAQVQKEAAAERRGQRSAMQNMGMGLYVGGSRLTQGVIGDYIAQYHQHSRGPATFINLSTHKVVHAPINTPPAHSVLASYGSPKLNANGKPGGAGVYNGREVNEWLFTYSAVYLPAISIAILDSWRIRLTGEMQYQRLRNDHTLPGQLIRSRLAQLDQLEAKI